METERIPVEERDKAHAYRIKAKDIAELRENVKRCVEQLGEERLIVLKTLNSLFAPTAAKLGTNVSEVVGWLGEQGFLKVLFGRRGGRLVCSASYYAMLKRDVPSHLDPLERAVEMHYELLEFERMKDRGLVE